MLKKIVVREDEGIQRIEKYLMKVLTNVPRNQIFKLLRLKEVKVNNARVNAGSQVQAGDVIHVWLPNDLYLKTKKQNKSKMNFSDSKGKLDIVFEDENIVIIEKPLGISCQRNHREKTSIQDLLLKHLYETKQWDNQSTFVPSICNRLDTNTTGLVLAAKNAVALNELNALIKQRLIQKNYYCLVFGILDQKQGTLSDFLIKNKDKNLVKVAPKRLDETYLTIITKYKVVKEFKKANWSLLDVQLITGRTHQIRAHFSYIKHPVVGDHKYGLEQFHDANANYPYQALHAYQVVFPEMNQNEFNKLSYLSNHKFKSKTKPWFLHDGITNY